MNRWIILFGALLIAAPVYAADDEGADEAPADEAPADDEGADEAPADAPAEEAPSADAPTEEAPADAPAEEAPVADAPAEDPSADAAPAEAADVPATAPKSAAETDMAPAPDPKMEAMKEHLAAFLDLPPPPLVLELPHNFSIQPVADVQVLVTAFDMDDPERNDPIVHGDSDHREGVAIRRARFGLVADWNDVFAVSVQAGWNDRYDALEPRPENADLVEALFAFTPGRGFGMSAGLARVAVGRQAQTSGLNLTLHERAMVSQKMAPAREPGLAFAGALGPEGHKVLPANAFQYGISISNGTSDFTGDLDPSPRIAGRARIDLGDEWVNSEIDHDPGMFGLSIGGGANYHWGLEAETLTAGMDLGLRVWRFTLLGEVMVADATPTFDTESLPDFLASRQSVGWYAQLSAAIVPEHFEATVRVEGYDDHTGLADAGDRIDISGGVGFYLFSTRLKVHIDYTHREETTVGYATANDSLVVQMQARL